MAPNPVPDSGVALPVVPQASSARPRPSVATQVPASGLTRPFPAPTPAAPPKRLFLDLFAGAASPVSACIARLGFARLEPIDLLVGPAHDLLNDSTFSNLQRLCASGLVGVAAAAPPCSAFSRARLRSGGPPPVRTLNHPRGIPDPTPSQAKELHMSSLLHSRTRFLLHLVACRGGLIWLENPSSSLPWLDPDVTAWCRLTAPHGATVAACQVGLALHKSWSFFCNDPGIAAVSSVCPHPFGFHPAVSGKRSSDGSFLTRHTAEYPRALAQSLAELASPWLSSISSSSAAIPLLDWQTLLPSRLPWPELKHRVEDGAGTCSTARPSPASCTDPLRNLRAAWSRRLLSDGLAVRIASALNSGRRDPPLSDSELEPFLADLRVFLEVTDEATWTHLTSVQPGQPFRLGLWQSLSVICADPDSDYLELLRTGVPLGISSTIPASKVMAPPAPPDSPTIPLQHCESSWKSAIDHADIVDELLQEELAQGWIAVVPGGDDELRQRYSISAVGKLGVVLSEGRPPRLVVDSSVSGVTCHTALPNRSCNPTLTDVFSCMPLSDSLERLVALVLDVAKAHRRILIREQDRGLLCFRHKNVLYQCTTLNFGARVSSFYWARAAGLLVRLVHRLIRVRHSAMIYVDDLLCLLDSASAPVWASHIVVLLLLLKVPLSWHKCALSAKVVWIGWELDVSLFTVRLDPLKFQRLCSLLRQALSSRRCSTHLLERITGKLLWLSSLFRTFRPSLAPLYSDQHAFLPTMTALDPQRWADLRAKLSPDLILLQHIGLAALPPGSRILRIGQSSVSSLSDLPVHPGDSRRIWIQSVAPHTGICILSEESILILRLWLDLANSGTACRSLLRPPRFNCEAFADACATRLSAGLGGYVRLPDGRQRFFRNAFSHTELSALFAWLPAESSLQSFISSWELLAQCALLYLLHQLLGDSHLPVHCIFRCDNSAAESSSWKGLSMASGLCSVLRAFFLSQQRFRISVHIDHVPGVVNDVADALSRSKDPSSLGFTPQEEVLIDWPVFTDSPQLSLFPSPSFFEGLLDQSSCSVP